MKKNTYLTAACITPVLGIKSIIFPSPENLEKNFWFWGQGNQYITILFDKEFFLPVQDTDISVTVSTENSVLQ